MGRGAAPQHCYESTTTYYNYDLWPEPCLLDIEPGTWHGAVWPGGGGQPLHSPADLPRPCRVQGQAHHQEEEVDGPAGANRQPAAAQAAQVSVSQQYLLTAGHLCILTWREGGLDVLYHES